MFSKHFIKQFLLTFLLILLWKGWRGFFLKNPDFILSPNFTKQFYFYTPSKRYKRNLMLNSKSLLVENYLRGTERKIFFFDHLTPKIKPLPLYFNFFPIISYYRNHKFLNDKVFDSLEKRVIHNRQYIRKLFRKVRYTQNPKKKEKLQKLIDHYTEMKPTLNLYLLNSKLHLYKHHLATRLRILRKPKSFTLTDLTVTDNLFIKYLEWKKHRTRVKHTHTQKFKNKRFFIQRKKKKKLLTLMSENNINKIYYTPRKLANYSDLPFLKIFNKLDPILLKKNIKRKKFNLIQTLKVIKEANRKKLFRPLEKIFAITFKKKKHNFYFTAINLLGEVIASFSSGQLLLKQNNKRNTKTRVAFFNAPEVIKAVSKVLRRKKIYKIKYFFKNTSFKKFGLKKMLEDFALNKIRIMKIVYVPSFSHGLPKKNKKKRRL